MVTLASPGVLVTLASPGVLVTLASPGVLLAAVAAAFGAWGAVVSLRGAPARRPVRSVVPRVALHRLLVLEVHRRLEARRFRRHGRDGLALVLDAVARSARTGASLRVAVTDAALVAPPPWNASLAAALRRWERGSGPADALHAWADEVAVPGARLAAAALLVGHDHGGDLATAAESAAAAVRAGGVALAEVELQSVQARVSAAVVALSPVVFTVLVATTDPQVRHVVVATPVGWACVLVGGALLVVGRWWMARLLAGARAWAGT